MRSVTRKAAVTAGLGAALAAGAAGSASASSVTSLADDLVPATSQAQSALPDTVAPFSVAQVVDRVPVAETLTPGSEPLGRMGRQTGQEVGRGMEQSMGHGMAESMTNMSGVVSQGNSGKGGLGGPLGNNPLGELPLGELPLGDQLHGGSTPNSAGPFGETSALDTVGI